LNRACLTELKPVIRRGTLTGLQAGEIFLPRPVIGVEHEFNIAAKLPKEVHRSADELCIDALLRAARQLGGRSARHFNHAYYDYDPYERGRLVLPGPSHLFQLYDDSHKLEIAHGEHTSTKALLAAEFGFLPQLRAIITRAAEILREDFGADPQLLVHLSGGDGGRSTCATAHVNIPVNNAVYEAAYGTLEAFDHLKEHSLRQLTIVSSVAAKGSPLPSGLALDARCLSYAVIAGDNTIEPLRAMQFRRCLARPDEGFENPESGCGRDMILVANWGQSEAGNFLNCLHQIETLRFQLSITGHYPPTWILEPDVNLLVLSRRLAFDRRKAAELHRRVLDEYFRFLAWLDAQVSSEVVDQLVPEVRDALRLDDRILTAIEHRNTGELVKMTDYDKKLLLIDKLMSGRPGKWRDHLNEIRNVCFAFASPQADVSPYWTFFRPRGLELEILTDRDLETAGPDPLTRSWFFANVANRFWTDPGMDEVSFDWDCLVRRRVKALAGGWVPRLRCDEERIDLSGSMHRNQPEVGNLDGIQTLDDLFRVFGASERTCDTVHTPSPEVGDNGARDKTAPS
jgi:hypothetical protein